MPLTRREFLAASGMSLACLSGLTAAPPAAPAGKRKKLAVISTIYHQYSHSDHIAGHFLYGYTIGGKHHLPDYEVVSMYVDQLPGEDLSVGLSKKFGFRHCKSVREALVADGDRLAVDAVLLIGEHGDYPENEYGQKLYPRFELFNQIVDEFRRCKQAVPVFNDKHLSYSWQKAKQMFDWSRELNFPLQAGSSLPVTWRLPDLEVPLGTKFESALAVGWGPAEIYGFHLLETLQCHVERRAGGETGVKSVRMLEGDAVWKSGDAGEWPLDLLDVALGRSHSVNFGNVRENAPEPRLFLVEYRDGFKASAVQLNGHITDFMFAARLQGVPEPVSTMHYLPARPGVKYFDGLVWNIERMLAAGKAVIPIERTLLISGALEAALHSLHDGKVVETPQLAVAYTPPEDSGHLRGPVDRIGQAAANRS